MSLKDKLEIGLKPDAPYRRDNLPESQQDDPDCIEGAAPGAGGTVEEARKDCDENPMAEGPRKALKKPRRER